jgi:glycosyltransferase involved in cell wall biosynthesis
VEKEKDMKLSVIVPSIRSEKLITLYNSVLKSFSGNFEFIVISPYDEPENLNIFENIRWIKSFRSPIACQQIGLIESKGDWITWAADDGEYLPGALDESFRLLGEYADNYKYVVMGKYLEGENPQKMDTNWYYILSNHDSMKLGGVPQNAWMLNCGVVSRELCIEVGGWDSARFQVCPMAYNDFAIRIQKNKAIFIIQDKIMFKCSHLPGMEGDHGPIHLAQTLFDQPIFTGLYMKPFDRIKIDINNWEESSEVWNMRQFKKG